MSTDDPIAVLERELIDAAHRQASGRLDRRRGTTGWIAIAVVVAVTVAFGLALLASAGRSPAPGEPPHDQRQTAAHRHAPAAEKAADPRRPSRVLVAADTGAAVGSTDP